jgi:hypothetical protein
VVNKSIHQSNPRLQSLKLVIIYYWLMNISRQVINCLSNTLSTDFRLSWCSVINVDSLLGLLHRVFWMILLVFRRYRLPPSSELTLKIQAACVSETSIKSPTIQQCNNPRRELTQVNYNSIIVALKFFSCPKTSTLCKSLSPPNDSRLTTAL